MKAGFSTLAVLALAGCVGAQPWLKRDLTHADLQKHRTEIIGQRVTVYAGVEQRYGGSSPPMLWLSAAARAHAFGPSRANFCIWADAPSGRLAALKPWAIVRVRGVVRTDESITPRAMECPSPLVVSVESVEVLPDLPKG